MRRLEFHQVDIRDLRVELPDPLELPDAADKQQEDRDRKETRCWEGNDIGQGGLWDKISKGKVAAQDVRDGSGKPDESYQPP